MYKQAKPFFMIVQTPLHAGSGQDLGIVDQPIQRERHTSFPKIEGSSLKGAIREVFEEYQYISEIKENSKLKELTDAFPALKQNGNGKLNTVKYKNEAIKLSFGPEEGDAHAGALGFTDARLLLFPVKSMKGVFAYITCPYVLERFNQELDLCGIKQNIDFLDNNQFLTGDKNKIVVCSGSDLVINNKYVILEEYSFEVLECNFICKIKDINKDILPELTKKIAIISDDDFKDFVNLSTEVITRTKINPETGTVKSGALFTEEYLPAESVLYSLALTTPIFLPKDEEKGIFALKVKENGTYKENPNLQNLAKIMNKKKEDIKEEDIVMHFFELGLPEVIQIGGNATIGKGIVRTKVYETSNNGGSK